MSHFYGTIQGTRGEATRCGKSKYDHDLKMKSCNHEYQETQENWVRVEKTTWYGNGEYKLLYEGRIGK